MIKIFLLLLTFILIVSCSSSGFTLKKKSSADEFLVEKKSPLVLPPSYGKLPLPGKVQKAETEKDEDKDIQELLGMSKDSVSNKQNNPENKSIEKSILEKIK